jgi:hypothetical protein
MQQATIGPEKFNANWPHSTEWQAFVKKLSGEKLWYKSTPALKYLYCQIGSTQEVNQLLVLLNGKHTGNESTAE